MTNPRKSAILYLGTISSQRGTDTSINPILKPDIRAGIVGRQRNNLIVKPDIRAGIVGGQRNNQSLRGDDLRCGKAPPL